ncbi:MAG: response regulator [Bacillota bacterium]
MERIIRLLLVDDHEVVRIGLKTLFEENRLFHVVGEAGTATESIRKAAELIPDVVIMDVRLPDGSGVAACREIRAARPEIKVIMLISFADEEAVMAALLAGAQGYVLKKIWSRDLIKAVETVSRGESLLDPAVTSKLIEPVKKPNNKGSLKLNLQSHGK